MKIPFPDSLLRFFILVLLIAFSCSKKGSPDQNNSCAIPELKPTSGVAFNHPCGVAVSRSGMVAVNEYNGFEQYGSLGKTSVYRNYSDFLTKAPPLAQFDSRGAEALAFDNNENLCVAETEQVAGIAVYRKLMQAGTISYNWVRTIQGGLNNPRGLAFDSHNRLYIANDGVGNIVRVDDPVYDGVQKIIGQINKGIKGLAMDRDTLFCTSYTDNSILLFPLKTDGTFGEVIHHSITVQQPVDVTVTTKLFAVSSPETGKITLYDRNGFVNGIYAGCVKEIALGKNTFGLAFINASGSDTGLLAANLDQNKVMYYQSN